ncbi:MAG TPA: SDR family NAD(P)-dependent oxidoreductase [Patescibacteria group bacterium]|nr:SDR family NAD(P)-dependent oxidoreductase [Patescibacteria group bacterium]
MDFYQGKTVLVTGAAGFIGSHLCDALLANGAKVIGLDNFISGRADNIAHIKNHPNFTFIEADVNQGFSTLNSQLSTLDLVFHLASPASPPGYQAHPVETYLVNSYGTHLLLTYLKEKHPTARFLFASTSEIYGDPLEHPQKETYFGNVNPNGIRSMYDEAKRLGETVCGVFLRSFNMDTRIIRIFNTYGPRMDPNDGRSLVEFCVRMLKNEPITLYGDGKQTRSYCFVSDLVAGISLFMASPDCRGETVNLGNPQEQSMLDLVHMIEAQLGKKATLQYKEARADDPRRRQPDISKAKTLLNWVPQVKIEAGLKETLAYFASLG